MIKVLTPIKETTEDYEAIEKKIKQLFRKEIYLPLVRLLGESTKIINEKSSNLLNAIKFGQIRFYRGTFSGRFNAQISKEIKALGARWDRKTGTWKISQSSLPYDVRNAILASDAHFQRKLDSIDKKLSQILPEEIAEKLKISDLFDTALWKVEKNFYKTLKGITIVPSLSKEQRKVIADDWQNNMQLFIKDWTQKEIVELRRNMQESVFSGNRYESAIKTISDSYDVSINKAKFLARQETGLLMSKFKEVRYKDAGVKKFIWTCVKMPHQPSPSAPYVKGNVRYDHGILDGKIFSWDHPRELGKNGRPDPNGENKPGSNKNPGEDYNCRCYAKPIVEFD